MMDDITPKSQTHSVWPWLVLVLMLAAGSLIAFRISTPRSIPGEITFKHAKPEFSRVATSPATSPGWFSKTYQKLKAWNSKLFKLPDDPKRTPKLQQGVDIWYPRLLLRYPELAVTMRNIPDAENGFLQLLNLMDRLKAENKPTPFPAEITDYLQDKGPWQTEVAQKWLAENSALVAELHAIGRLTERSMNRIPVERSFSISAKLLKNFSEIFILEARLAAERGEVAAALEAVHTARNLIDHSSEIETPTLLIATVKILTQQNLAKHVLADIIPALPAGQVDPVAWENALNLPPADPAEYARLVRGEWHENIRFFMLPFVLNPDPATPCPDGGELLDFYSLHAIEICRAYESAAVKDLATLKMPPLRDASHLSDYSREFTAIMDTGSFSWVKGWTRAQSVTAMTRAAFAILKDQPIPQDPIYGFDYVWDAATRQLSFPPGVPGEMKIPSITVPNITRAEPNTPQP
jgi:hypothetical protein